MKDERPLELFVPFEKGRIDVEKRMVYGRAQIEEGVPDLQGDIVSWDATKRAFNDWFTGIRKGNVREMHRKTEAVGRAVVMKPLEDSREMLVGVHVSKGAESTWQKVLDGTLRGFSIGGFARRSQQYFDSRLGRRVNKVLDYVLTELSLVDVPANPKCRIIGIQKNLVAPGLSGDVTRKAGNMAGQNAALAAIAEMAKTVSAEDDLLIIKRSDITTQGEGDGAILVLDGNGDVSDIFKGADLAEVGDSYETAITKSASDIADAVAEFGKSFVALCKAAGLDPAQVVEEQPQGGGSEIGKGAGLSRGDIMEIVKSAVEQTSDSRFEQIFDTLGEIKKNISGVAPRKGADGTEAVVSRAITKLGDGAGDGSEGVDAIRKALQEDYQKRGALIAKMESGQKLTPQEETERQQLGVRIDRHEAALTGNTRIVSTT